MIRTEQKRGLGSLQRSFDLHLAIFYHISNLRILTPIISKSTSNDLKFKMKQINSCF